MVAKFAALESRLNTAAFVHLSNTTATLDWEPVTGIFDNGFALGNVGAYGMASAAPTFTLPSASTPENVIGKELDIGEDTVDTTSVRYTVVAHEPDGTGISRLILEKA